MKIIIFILLSCICMPLSAQIREPGTDDFSTDVDDGKFADSFWGARAKERSKIESIRPKGKKYDPATDVKESNKILIKIYEGMQKLKPYYPCLEKFNETHLKKSKPNKIPKGVVGGSKVDFGHIIYEESGAWIRIFFTSGTPSGVSMPAGWSDPETGQWVDLDITTFGIGELSANLFYCVDLPNGGIEEAMRSIIKDVLEGYTVVTF